MSVSFTDVPTTLSLSYGSKLDVYRADQPEVDWRRIAVAWVLLASPVGADEEVTYVALTGIMAHATAIADEENVSVLRRPEGLVLIAGAPITYDDDIDRTVRAAWRLTRDLAHLHAVRQSNFSVRTGISFGGAVASCAAVDPAGEMTIFGAPWDDALDLAAKAPHDQIWVSAAISAHCASSFTFERLANKVPGQAPTAGATGYRLIAPAQGGRAIALPSPLEAPLVGRSAELTTVTRFVQELPPGRGGHVWIGGEAGIGKSRFLEEVSNRLQGDGTHVLPGRCLERCKTQAFAMFGSLLARLLHVPQGVEEEAVRTHIDRVMSGYLDGNKLGSLVAQLLIGLKPSAEGAAILGGLTPEQLQQEMFSTVYQLLVQLSTGSPLALVLDDLQWIDPWSSALLDFLHSLTATNPVIFVCSARTEQDAPNIGIMRQPERFTAAWSVQLHLEPLPAAESAQLLDRLTVAPLPPALRDFIVASCHGNPYHLEAFIRMLAEAGELRWMDNGWFPANEVDVRRLRLPDSLESVIRTRVARLPRPYREVLRYAAVLGQPFAPDCMSAVSGIPAVDILLDGLQTRNMLAYDSVTHLWRVSHTSLEHVVYQSLLRAQRRAMHAQVADMLATCWRDHREPHAGAIAYHFQSAGDLHSALEYAVVAGEWAARVRGTTEAIGYFEQAANFIAQLPMTEAGMRWRVSTGLGEMYRIAGQYALAERTLTAGLSLAADGALSPFHTAALLRRLGETLQAQGQLETARTYFHSALAALDNAAGADEQTERFHCLFRIADTHFMQGNLRLASLVARDAQARAEQLASKTELALAQNLLGGIHYRHGDLEASMRCTQTALQLCQSIGFTWGLASAQNNLGIVAVAAGRWSAADTYFSTSLKLCQESGNMAGIVIANLNLGLLYRDLGRLDSAVDYFSAGLQIAEAYRMEYHLVSLTLGMAQAMLMRGEVDEAADLLQRGKKQAHAVGTRDLEAEAIYVESEYWHALTDWSRAELLAQHAAALAAEVDHRRIAAAAWRLATRCALATGNVVRANQFHAKAEAALAQTSDRLEHGRIVFESALLHHAEHNLEATHRCLAEAQTVFASLGALRDLRDVERLQTLVSTQSI